jgi:hypothetical protein
MRLMQQSAINQKAHCHLHHSSQKNKKKTSGYEYEQLMVFIWDGGSMVYG